MSAHMDTSENVSDTDVTFLRQVVTDLMAKQEYSSALFWSDKVCCISSYDPQDILIQARCLYHLREFHRAIHLIKSRKLHENNLAGVHLAAKCHFMAKENKEAFQVISDFETVHLRPPSGDDNNNKSIFGCSSTGSKLRSSLNASCGHDISSFNITKHDATANSSKPDPQQNEEMKWKSSLALLKGQIYEASDNRGIASQCFKEALHYNIFNFEAFQSLVRHQMLSLSEEKELLSLIPPEHKLTHCLYSSLLKKYSQPSDPNVTHPCVERLQNNIDILTAKAESLYYNCDYFACLKITTEVLERDLYNTTCLPIHIACLMELKKTVELFGLAHKLVDLYPESPISWHAVGCYYLMINKTEPARRYLSKATTLDPVFGPAWLLYGHSFAVESEHDQAMAAYFKASHLMKGCHLPLLYIGLEYGVTDNTKLAEKFFNQALIIAPKDPFVLHELGVVSFQNQDYDSALKHFSQALDIIKYKKEVTRLPEKWEPLLNNMGHVLRKLKKYEEALDFHKQAMILSPQNASSYSAIGFVYALMMNWNLAVEYFHKALGLKREDQFSSQMLSQSIEHLINSMTPLKEESPPYSSAHLTAVDSEMNAVDGKTASSTSTPQSSATVTGVTTRRRRKSGREPEVVEMDVSTE